MTVPAGDIYCPSCEEICHDHPSICTVCGTQLESPPSPAVHQRSPQPPSFLDESYVEDIRRRSDEIRGMIQMVQAQVEATQETQQDLFGMLEEMRTLFPANQQMWDPSNAPAHTRPTAAKTLENLPRTMLSEYSSLFYTSEITVAGQKTHATVGEFGIATPTFSWRDAGLVVANPITGKDLSRETVEAIEAFRKESRRVVLFVDRGLSTFVDKAVASEKAGAHAIVVGNNKEAPWPYVMQDSKGEAKSMNLQIPAVMVSLAEGRRIKALCRAKAQTCSISIAQHSNRDCVICTEEFQAGHRVLQIPGCGHIFHDECALRWLSLHNTCPFCRQELPTDDEEYNMQRRREQRTHAGSERQRDSWSSSLYG